MMDGSLGKIGGARKGRRRGGEPVGRGPGHPGYVKEAARRQGDPITARGYSRTASGREIKVSAN